MPTIRTILATLIISSNLTAAPALAQGLRVVTDIAPVQSLVARVMQGAGEPDVLLAPGSDPHHFAFHPSEASALAEADLVFWVGPAMTDWLAEPVATLATKSVVVGLLDATDARTLGRRDGAIFATAGRTEAPDPHAWLDPTIAMFWTTLIAQALALADPSNAGLYADNASAAQVELAALDAELAQTLADVTGRGLIVAHDSLQYLEQRYGIAGRGALTLAEGDRPGPQRITALRALIAQGDVDCIATDPEVSSDWIDLLREGNDVAVTEVETMGLDLATGPELYPALMRRLAQGLAACLR